jgi:YbbR domain-containing protein
MKLNVPIAIFSLVCSIMLWLHVQSQQALKVTRPIEFPLEPLNLNSKYIIKSYPTKVQVMAEGTVEAHERFKEFMKTRVGQTLVATVDLSDAVPEVSNYRVRLPRSEEFSKLDLSLSDPADASIVIQEVLHKRFTVEAIPTNIPDGLIFSQAKVQPSSVEVRGGSSEVARVDRVRALVNLTDYQPGKPVRARVEILDQQGKPIGPGISSEPEVVDVYPALAVAPPERPLIVAVRIAEGSGPAPGYRLVGYSVEPVTVMVRGDQRLLQRLQSIPTEPIQLSGLKGKTVRKVRLVPQTGLQLMTGDTVRITLDIEPIPPVESPPNSTTPNTNTPGQ